MDSMPADGDAAWVTMTLDNLEDLIRETRDTVEQYHQSLRYRYDDDEAAPPEIPAQVAVIRKVLTRLLTQEGQETRSLALRAIERAWPSSAAIIAISAAGVKPEFFMDLIKTCPDAKEAACAVEILCKMYSHSDETVSIIWDEEFMKVTSEAEDGIGPLAQRKKDIGQLLDKIFRVLQDRIQRDDKDIDALMNIFPYLLGSFEEGAVRYLVEEGGTQFFASYLKDLKTPVGVADAAATVFSFHLTGYQLSLKGADKVWDAIHAVPDFYKHMVMQIRAYEDDDDRIDLQLQCLVILRLLSLYPPKDTIPSGLNAEQALKLEARRKSIVEAGAIPLMRSIILGDNPRPQAIDVLSNLSESDSVDQAEIWEGVDATFLRRGLYDRGNINDGSTLMNFFLKYISISENLKACLERGCLTPLRYHLQERDHAEAAAEALLLIADYEHGGRNGTDIWNPMLVAPIGMFIGQDGGAWEFPILGLKLLKSIITFPGLTAEEREEGKTAFVDLGVLPVMKFMISRLVGEYPLLANTAADVYPLLDPEGLPLELKREEGEDYALKSSLGESVQAWLTYNDEEVVAAGRLAVKLLLEDKPYKLLTDSQREEISAALAEFEAATADKDDEKEEGDAQESKAVSASIDESADALRLLAHALFVPFTQYSTELIGVALSLISIFFSPGPGLAERKKAFESGAALFIPSVFSDQEEPELTFERDFPTFNPNPVPRDPELPPEEGAEEVEMEIIVMDGSDSDGQEDETEQTQEEEEVIEETAASDDEDDDEAKTASEGIESKSEADGAGSDAEAEAEDETDGKEEAESQDASNSDKSGSDSDEDSDSDDVPVDNVLPQSAYDFLLAVRGAVLDPKADMEEWAGHIMRDIITSPIPAVVKAGIMEFSNYYTRTWGGKQWNLIAKHGLVPILRGMLDHPDESMRPLLLLNQLGDSDAPQHFKKNTFYSPDLLEKLGAYLTVPPESGRYDTFQALEIIKGTYLECGYLEEIRQIRDKLQTLADQPSETEDGERIHYPEAAKEILEELKKMDTV